ncbi:MAG: hypothetical protein NTX45_20070 [Proteobacteria bacterium]|nr:hypothetical protein [Pseudomonadota bacterium]
MTIFFINAIKGDEKLAEAIDGCEKIDALMVKPGQWFVSFKGTSQQLSDLLGITKGETESAIVLAVSGYYGRASTSIWEWLKANWEGDYGP